MEIVGNGNLKVPLNKHQYFIVHGGPYWRMPAGYTGVKLAKEIAKPCVISIPSQDFGLPNRKDVQLGLERAVDLLMEGKPLYAGCMGGIGRTGTFLAILVKVFGVKKPIKYVRKHYLDHAVETKEQEDFVRYFRPTRQLKRKIARARWRGYLRFWRKNLTNLPKSNSVADWMQAQHTAK